MQKYQDTTNGKEWHFDDGVDISTLSKVPATLTSSIIEKPSEFHVWNSGGWVLDNAAKTAVENADIIRQIVELEATQARPIREHFMGDSSAMQRVLVIDAKINLLRAGLK